MQLSECVLDRRKNELSQITSVINNSLCAFKAVIKEFGWSESSIISEDEEIATCPLDSGHRMPKKSLEKHLETCTWIKRGYTREEKETALPSSHFFYKNSTSVVPVLIDKETQFKIFTEAARDGKIDLGGGAPCAKEVPLTMDHCMTELTPQERFAIYDYVVSHGKAMKKQAPLSLEDLQMNFEEKPSEGEHKKSRIEILAELRDYKRRRQSYRAKNVHITRKSYTEVLSEVIQNQMHYLQHMLKPEKEPLKMEAEGNASRQQRSRSPTPNSVAEKNRDKQEKRKDDSNLNRHHKNDYHHKRSHERSRKHTKRYSSEESSSPSTSSMNNEDEKLQESEYEESEHERQKRKHKKRKHKKHKHRKHKTHSEED